MTRAKVRWTITEEFEAEVEIDGWDGAGDPDDTDGSIDSMLADLEDDNGRNSTGVVERDVIGYTVIRLGDEPVTIGDVVAPQYVPEWDDDEPEGDESERAARKARGQEGWEGD